jgi:glycosyltransferase involved in cell wall biosynthesis
MPWSVQSILFSLVQQNKTFELVLKMLALFSRNYMQPLIQIGSLDTFHMPALQAGLALEFRTEFYSTWSLNKPGPNPTLPRTNAWALHYLLWIYKRFPAVQRNNKTYLPLCEAFDTWFTSKLKPEISALCFLSGFGTKAMRKAHQWGKPVVVDTGSTHTDFQHRIVWEEYQRNGLRQPLFPEAYRSRIRQEFIETDFVQIPTEFVKQTYLEAGIPESKILKATYGTDAERFSARKETDINPMFRAICPSGVNLRKGARLLVEAWRKLGWKETEAELHWVGWPGHPDVKHLFRDPLRGVIWHGWMPHSELCKLYRSCDVLVLPSFEEGFARVLVEGAASGLPPIATPNTGIEDFFTPGNPEGWLIPCNNVDALCEALIEAKSDRQKTFELGQLAAARARSGFSWEDYGVQVRGNFGRVLGS